MHEGSRIADRYRIERLIGRGGTSQVYEAIDTKFGALVALKLARPPDNDFAEFLARFKREAKIGRLLGRCSSRFVRALDWGQHGDDLCYLVMDLVEGATDLDLYSGTLDEKIERLIEASLLVQEVHKQRIVHRDLKPANFLTSREGRIHLGDFGLAKLLDESDSALSSSENMITQTGLAMGTPFYMAPEQVDAKNVDQRADIYALGVMLFQILTGELPFEGSIGQLIAAQQEVLAGVRPMPRAREFRPDVPQPLDELCARAMELDDLKRLPSAAGLVQGLGATRRAKLTTAVQARTSGRRQAQRLAPATRRVAPQDDQPTQRGLPKQAPPRRGPAPGAPQGPAGERRRRRPLPRGLRRVQGSDEFVNEKDGTVLVRVPGGVLQPQADQASGGDATKDLIRVEGFFVAKYPISWGQYYDFCQATGREPPEQRFDAGEDHPVHGVSWYDAWAYCAWANLRLPTEVEWELAARGQDERRWPWGDAPPSPERCNTAEHPTYGGAGTSPLGSFPRGVSPVGCHDMVGNVLEWLADADDPPPGPSAPPQKPMRSLRGGAFRLSVDCSRPGHTIRLSPRAREPHVGFRVACSLFRRPASERGQSSASGIVSAVSDHYQSSAEHSVGVETPSSPQVVVQPPRDEGRRIIKHVRAFLPTIADSVARTQRREIKFVFGPERRGLAFAIPSPDARYGYIEHRVKLDPSRLLGAPTGLINLLHASNQLNATQPALRCLISADRLRLRRYVFLAGRRDFTPASFRAEVERFVSDWEYPFRALRQVQKGAPWYETIPAPAPEPAEATGALELEELLEGAKVDVERLEENRLSALVGDQSIELSYVGGEVRAWLRVRAWDVPTEELLEVRQGGHATSIESLIDELNELNHERHYTLAWDPRSGVVARAILRDEGGLPRLDRLLGFVDALAVEARGERFASLGDRI